MKYFFRFFIGMIIIFLFQCNALGADKFKIGVVDIQILKQNSKGFQKIRVVLRKKKDDLQQKLDKEKKSLLKIENDFKKQSMMLSLDAKEDKRRELQKKRRYVQYIFDDYTQEMKETELEAEQMFVREIKEVVQKIATKEGLLLVFMKGTPGLIAYDDVIDITDKVIKAYDKKKK